MLGADRDEEDGVPRSTGSQVALTASRLDQRTGIREDAELFGDEGDRCFGVRTAPAGPPAAAVLVCSSVGNDLVKQYRRDVLLARALAEAGVAVQRFQYRGTGNSDGDAAAVDRASMVADAEAAQGVLDRAAPGVPGAVLATRFGALVAAEVAGADARPLVLVEPVLEGDRYFKEAFRAKLMQGIAGGNRATAASLLAALERGEPVDVLGSPLHPAFHATWKDRSVPGALAGPPRPVLVVQLGADIPVRADLEKAAAALGDAGHDVEVVRVPGREAWWYLDERDLLGNDRSARNARNGRDGAAGHDADGAGPPAAAGLVDGVVPWLTARLGVGG